MSGQWVKVDGLVGYRPVTHTGTRYDGCVDSASEPCYCSCHHRLGGAA